MSIDVDAVLQDDPPPDEQSIDYDKGSGKISVHARQRMTEAELLEYCQLDPRSWKVTSITIKAWNGFYKRGVRGEESHQTVDLYGHHATIKRRFDECLFTAMDRILEDVQSLPTEPVKHQGDGDLLYVMSLFDAHFGKLAWAPETGTDYDLSIADQVYRQAVVDLAGKVEQRRIGRILFPIGQDFGHFDNAQQKTTKGTEIESDSRWPKVYQAMADAAIWAVREASQIAPVEVRYSGGNHDRIVSYMICMLIAKLFADDPNVDVSRTLDPASRQYIRWGNCALGLTHGDGSKGKRLRDNMTDECPFWSDCPHREMLTGHLHHERVQETGSLTTRVLPSLSGTDWYHYHNGWTHSKRSALGLLYDANHGINAIHYAYALR